jgi:UvrD/REP helicase N-terminal domain
MRDDGLRRYSRKGRPHLMAFAPTDEQQAIIAASDTGRDLVVTAGAGAGKTSTLKLIAKAKPDEQGIYIAYNRAIADEATASFPRNVRCNTAHSLAYRAIGRNYRHRLDSARLPGRVVADILGIHEPLDVGAPKPLPRQQLARLALETVQKFCHSADPDVMARHVPFVTGLDSEQTFHLREYLLPHAQRAWADLTLDNGKLRFEHDHYLKLWGLSEPKLFCDFVMLDEAQDANPVIADIIERQTGVQKILVGDENQAIYGWRGAEDAMSDFDGQRLQLTQSFRFGPAIAEEANKWLSYLDSDLRIKGYDAVDSTVSPIAAPGAVLCRTNAGAVAEAVNARAEGRKAALVGGGESIRRLAEAAQDLLAGDGTSHPELFMFESWGEVQEYVKEDAGGGDLRVFVKMIDDMGPEQVIDTVNALTSEQLADVVISTAHKSKGREWETVRIATDFSPPKDEGAVIPRAEAMLAYVSVTRAKRTLDRIGLSWIDGFIGGEN